MYETSLHMWGLTLPPQKRISKERSTTNLFSQSLSQHTLFYITNKQTSTPTRHLKKKKIRKKKTVRKLLGKEKDDVKSQCCHTLLNEELF